MNGHSILAPSSAGIWGKPGGCTAFPVLSMMYPQEDTDESREGELVHQLGADMLNAIRTGGYYTSAEVSPEIAEGVELYVQDVASVMRTRGVFSNPHLGIEQRVVIPRIHADCFGTPDCFIYDQASHHLTVWDLKFGYGVVEAYENWQCIAYIAGLMDLFGINGATDQLLTVDIRIVQPRAFHRDGPIRSWVTNGGDLRTHINILRNNAEESFTQLATLRTGSHCRYCPLRFDCPAAFAAGVQLYEAAMKPDTTNATPERLGYQLTVVRRALEQLQWLESGIEAQVKSLLQSGKSIPGWGLEPTYGRQKWSLPVDVVIATGAMAGVDLAVPTACTPKQAIKKGMDESVVKSISETPQSGLTLVRDTNKAMRIFK